MNLLVIIVLIVLLCKIVDGYRKGMVKEIISFISLIIMCIVVGLIGSGLQSYVKKEFAGVVIAVLLLSVLGIAHHLLGVVFFSAKMLTKLPIIHWLDKVLGMVVGALETVLILWTIYAFIHSFGLGMIGQQILTYTQDNEILSWIYQHNYLAGWIRKLGGEISLIQF